MTRQVRTHFPPMNEKVDKRKIAAKVKELGCLVDNNEKKGNENEKRGCRPTHRTGQVAENIVEQVKAFENKRPEMMEFTHSPKDSVEKNGYALYETEVLSKTIELLLEETYANKGTSLFSVDLEVVERGKIVVSFSPATSFSNEDQQVLANAAGMMGRYPFPLISIIILIAFLLTLTFLFQFAAIFFTFALITVLLEGLVSEILKIEIKPDADEN